MSKNVAPRYRIEERGAHPFAYDSHETARAVFDAIAKACPERYRNGYQLVLVDRDNHIGGGR